jgi:hypothetical protein
MSARQTVHELQAGQKLQPLLQMHSGCCLWITGSVGVEIYPSDCYTRLLEDCTCERRCEVINPSRHLGVPGTVILRLPSSGQSRTFRTRSHMRQAARCIGSLLLPDVCLSYNLPADPRTWVGSQGMQWKRYPRCSIAYWLLCEQLQSLLTCDQPQSLRLGR